MNNIIFQASPNNIETLQLPHIKTPAGAGVSLFSVKQTISPFRPALQRLIHLWFLRWSAYELGHYLQRLNQPRG